MWKWPRLTFVVMLLLGLAACRASMPERNNTANRLLNRGQAEQALRVYQSAQVLAPDEPMPYYNAGTGYLQAGEYERAEAAFRQALLTADPNQAVMIYYNLGEAYFKQAQYAQAMDAYRQVLQVRPGDEDARYNLELAWSLLPTATVSPTPTPSHQPTDQLQESTPTPTATPTVTEESPEDDITPTPSPLPESSNPTQTPDDQGNRGGGDPETTPTPDDLDDSPLDEALEFLNSVQANQNTLPLPAPEGIQGSIPERDW